MTEPQPGEVWIITESEYGGKYDKIRHHNDQPFIVSRVARSTIFCLGVNGNGEGVQVNFPRHQWDWDKHACRLWPGVPTWNELRVQGLAPARNDPFALEDDCDADD